MPGRPPAAGRGWAPMRPAQEVADGRPSGVAGRGAGDEEGEERQPMRMERGSAREAHHAPPRCPTSRSKSRTSLGASAVRVSACSSEIAAPSPAPRVCAPRRTLPRDLIQAWRPGPSVLHRLPGASSAEQPHVLVDRDATRLTARGGDEPELSPAALLGKCFCSQPGAIPSPLGEDPDLEEVHRLGAEALNCCGHAGSGAHPLHVAGADDRAFPANPCAPARPPARRRISMSR